MAQHDLSNVMNYVSNAVLFASTINNEANNKRNGTSTKKKKVYLVFMSEKNKMEKK